MSEQPGPIGPEDHEGLSDEHKEELRKLTEFQGTSPDGTEGELTASKQEEQWRNKDGLIELYRAELKGNDGPDPLEELYSLPDAEDPRNHG